MHNRSFTNFLPHSIYTMSKKNNRRDALHASPIPKLSKIINYFYAINPSQFNSPYFYRIGIERHVKAGEIIPPAVNIGKNKTQRKTLGWLETHAVRLYDEGI